MTRSHCSMDLITGIVILGAISLVVIPATMVMRSYYAAKMAMSRKMSAVARQRAAKPAMVPETQTEMPGWLPGLLEELGVGSDLLEGDEIPPELARFLPAIKGFIDSGGLEKILGAQAAGSGPGGPDRDDGNAWF